MQDANNVSNVFSNVSIQKRVWITVLVLFGLALCTGAVLADSQRATVRAGKQAPAGHPVLVKYLSYYVTPGIVSSVAAAGGYAYVADGYAGVEIMDVSNPYSPTLVGSFHTPADPVETLISGTLLYISYWCGDLQIMDVSQPATPTLVGSGAGLGYVQNMVLVGPYLYVVEYNFGLSIIDVSKPAQPTRVGLWNDVLRVLLVGADERYVYVAEDMGSPNLVHILDRSNPISLTEVGSYLTPWPLTGIALVPDHAYFFDLAGFSIVNVSDPAHPWLVERRSLGGTEHLAQAGQYLYLASVPGLLVFDVSDPARPVEVGQGQLPMSGYYVDVTDEHVYVTDWNVWGCPNKCSGGLGIFDVLELAQQVYLPLVRSP